ncbi:hypothetical protein WR25_14659 [Diploscapter pachys]|uniref:Amino acid transporter transmembrane domain-containing protein n=1 Tax=Diploscapter pachys TaxID=2018661 RepID=A0A2A2LJG7_9BILA|nr:hypothetical protein WR25_14659 [Diploscapter pachys]
MASISPLDTAPVPNKQQLALESGKIEKPKNEKELPVPSRKHTISTFSGVITLSKAMVNAGVFSLPYAWKLGGLWVSFAASILIALINWYGDYILAKSAQYLSKKVGRSSLDYGHFAKKVCETSDIEFLRKHSHAMVFAVDMSILAYQLGMCSVAILFISDNMIVSFFAIVSTVFLFFGSFVIAQYTIRQPNHWSELPAYTDFKSTIMMMGILTYAFEGQTMVLPVENKLAKPENFLAPVGVLSITMVTCSSFMTFLGFIGYTAFAQHVGPTITINVPKDGFYTSVNICLMVQSLLGNGMAMYVIFDMFQNGFRTKFGKICPSFPIRVADKGFRVFWVLVTYLMVVLIPHLETMMSLVGVTAGTMCALIFPPLFEVIVFWTDWKDNLSTCHRMFKIIRNFTAMILGFAFIACGVYANMVTLIELFAKPHQSLTD